MISRIEELLKNTKVEWKKLGEIAEIQMCKRILKNQTKNEGDIPFLQNMSIIADKLLNFS